MLTKRAKGYEDLDAQQGSFPSSNSQDLDPNWVMPQEIEMASVSVVPDGKICLTNCINKILEILYFRYIYCNTSSKCSWVWLVSGETVLMDWIMLDGR